MRFERDVNRCASRLSASGLQRQHFGMRLAPLAMPAFADDMFALSDDTADARIGLRAVTTERGELDCPLHHPFVECGEHVISSWTRRPSTTAAVLRCRADEYACGRSLLGTHQRPGSCDRPMRNARTPLHPTRAALPSPSRRS